MNSPSFPRQGFPDSCIFPGSGTTGQESGSVARGRFHARNIDKSAIDNFLAGMDSLDIRVLAGRVCAEAQRVCPMRWCNNELKKIFERHDIEYESTGYGGLRPPKSEAVMNLLLGLQKDSGQKKSDDGKPLHERFCALLQDGQGVFTGGQQLLITEIGKHVSDSTSVPGSGLMPSVKGTSELGAPSACGTDEAENSVASAVKSDVNKPVDQVERAPVGATSGLPGELSVTSDNYDPVVAPTGGKLTRLANSLNMRRVDLYEDRYVSTSLSLAVTVKPGHPVVPVLVGMKSNFHSLPDYIQCRLAKACPHTPDDTVTFVHAFMIADTTEAFAGTSFKILLDSKINPEYGSLFKESENHHYCPVSTVVSLPKELVSNSRFFRTSWLVHEQGADDDVVTLSYGRSEDNGYCQDIGFHQLQPTIGGKGGGVEVGLAIPFGVQIRRLSDEVMRRLRYLPPESGDYLARSRVALDQCIDTVLRRRRQSKDRGTQSKNRGSVDSGTVPIAAPSESPFWSFRLARTDLTNSTGIITVRTVTGINVSTAGELKSRLLDKANCTGSEGNCKISIL